MSCLLHPDKRTLIIGFCTSALGQTETEPLHELKRMLYVPGTPKIIRPCLSSRGNNGAWP